MNMILVPVKAGDIEGIFALLDEDDAHRLGERKLSLGSHGYVQMWDGYVTVVHRWVMGAIRGDRRIVDHINGDPLDNRKANLRFVTAGESSANVATYAASGYRGVYPNRKGWRAAAMVNGRKHYLGTYPTPEEAAQVVHQWLLSNQPGYTGARSQDRPRPEGRTKAERRARRALMQEIRLWARSQGLAVSDVGRVPVKITSAYERAALGGS